MVNDLALNHLMRGEGDLAPRAAGSFFLGSSPSLRFLCFCLFAETKSSTSASPRNWTNLCFFLPTRRRYLHQRDADEEAGAQDLNTKVGQQWNGCANPGGGLRSSTCVQDCRFHSHCQKKVVPRGPDHLGDFPVRSSQRHAVIRVMAAPHCPGGGGEGGGRRLSRKSAYSLWITAAALLPPTSSPCVLPPFSSLFCSGERDPGNRMVPNSPKVSVLPDYNGTKIVSVLRCV